MAMSCSRRVLAAVTLLPFALAVCSGVAHADNVAAAGQASNSAVAGVLGSGVGGANLGNSATVQQVATGWGASNQNNTSQANGSGFTATGQANTNHSAVVDPTP
ncbi:hypothetical protein [Streptomyces sp. NPDC097619]|uniref:hypothetical protein n=1 Tax=Streptomyces sp. NPDC097619 TaxID=3157228 RepID=UPI00332F2E90